MSGHPCTWREVKEFLKVEDQLNDEWQARFTVRVFRTGQWLVRKKSRRWGPARRLWWGVYHVWVHLLLGADLPPQVECGPGLRLAHGGRGVIWHPRINIGARATIFHRVTIGMLGGRGVPSIGDDVVLGAGCAVLGQVRVHDGAAVGPNAVVVVDVPPLTNLVAPSPVATPRLRRLTDERRTARGREVPRE